MGFKMEEGEGREGGKYGCTQPLFVCRTHILNGRGHDWCGWLHIDRYLPINSTYFFRSSAGRIHSDSLKRRKYGGFAKFRFVSFFPFSSTLLPLPRPSFPSPFSTCFQNGGLCNQILKWCSFRKKTPALQANPNVRDL